MDSTVFKYKHQYQQHQHQHQYFSSIGSGGSSSNSNNFQHQYLYNSNKNNHNNNNNNNNQNSIFILNPAANNILANNPKLYYVDPNEDNNVVSSKSSVVAAATSNTASTSVWSSASSTMCSPAAHAIQMLFNCSSNSSKLNHGNYSGIESKSSYKNKAELLKKKSKFWKYLEGEANDKNNQRGIEGEDVSQKQQLAGKSLKHKSKYWSKSYESDNQNNQQDLSELLEYSCSLCDNCRCVDCQIGYFDCENSNSDDSNSEYSFHMSAYEEDEEEVPQTAADDEDANYKEASLAGATRELTTIHDDDCCNELDNVPLTLHKLRIDAKIPPPCDLMYCVCNEETCNKVQCCQQCFMSANGGGVDVNFTNIPDH